MATMIVLSAVVERLRYCFTEDGLYSQLNTEDVESLLDRLWRLVNDDEAICKHMRDENFVKQVRKLEKILYRIEDLVESHKVGVRSRHKISMMRRPIRGMVLGSIFKETSGRVANGNFLAELRSLTNQTNEILDFILDDNSPVRALETSQVSLSHNIGGPSLPGTSSMAGEQIIRMEHDEEELVSALTEGLGRIEVVSICGMGGIGKTTLAKKVCSKPKVKQHFYVSAWHTITQVFRIRDIFRSILPQMWSDPVLARSNEMELAQVVHKYLKGWRWLVVLDDVWSIEAWESIRFVLPEDHNGSRILVTTRDNQVASSLSSGYIHNMDFLDEKQSWELFKRRAQLTDSELDSEQVQIAKKIVRQSGGLPFAIVVLANILKTKSFDEWKSLLRDSAVEISETHALEALTRPLDLSYNSLSSVLKPCLLYMGTFPEGSKIEAETMFQLWIAEGLISEERSSVNGATMMELAGYYFDELTSRNLVQVPEEEMSTHQSFRYGCLHDLLRDICILKAKEEGFFEIVKLGSVNQPKGSVFRCAVYLDKHGKMDIHPYLRFDLRSLLFFNLYHQFGEDLIHSWAIPDLSNLKWIRILHFEGVDFKGGTLPAGTENLVLLRYLSLKDCYLEKLPTYISNFLFLTTLDLRVKKRCKVIVPNVLCKLQKLRYLYLPLEFQTPNHEKLQLDGMKELEILENFDTSICNAGGIIMMARLQHLAVSSEGELEDLEQIFQCIELNENHLSKTSLDIRNFDSYTEERLSFIQKLFSCRVLHILRLEGRIGKISELDATYTSFTEIHLNCSQLEDDPMQTLKRLLVLRILVLESDAYIGKEMYCSDFGFPELRSLKLSKLYNLERWEVEVGGMPKLSTLTIENCRRMKMLPEKLGRINALRKLKINMMSKKFVGRLQNVDGKGGEDLYKININCTIELGSDNLWPESTDSTTEQNNSFESKIPEFQIPSSTGTRDFASSSAYPQPNEWERDVYLQ